MNRVASLFPTRAAAVLAGRWRLTRVLPMAGWPLTLVLTTLHLLVAVQPTATAVLAGYLVGAFSRARGMGSVALAAAALGGLLVLGQMTTLLRDVAQNAVIRRIDSRIRSAVRRLALTPDQIVHLESPQFADDALRADDRGSGLSRSRSAGAAAVGQLVVVFRMLSAVTATVLIALYFPLLGPMLLAAALVVRSILRRQWTNLVRILDSGADRQREAAYLADLPVGGAPKEVRLFGLAHWVASRYSATATSALASTWRELWRVLRRQWWTAALMGASAVAALAIPAAATLSGDLSVSRLVSCMLAAWTVFGIAVVGHEAFDIEYGLNAVRALERLTTRYGGGTTTERRPAAEAPGRVPLVRFEDVVFAYPGATKPVFDGLNLTIRPGESLAVVGHNGVGKTTLVKLLTGLYQPVRGRITIDGRDLADIHQRSWRDRTTVLFQDFIRYPSSLSDNVALSVPTQLGNERAVWDALRQADAQRFAATLPQGIGTSLWPEGRDGVDLSGGQWQRVAIARALYAVAAGRYLLVLDEPTAHLDMRAEAVFYDEVVGAVRDVTVLLVSHRLSTVRSADRIVLLNGGAVAEEGSHDELMALKGEYARLFTLQASAFGTNGQRPYGDTDE